MAGISRLAPEKPSAYEDEPSARMPTVTKKPAGALLGGIILGAVAACSYWWVASSASLPSLALRWASVLALAVWAVIYAARFRAQRAALAAGATVLLVTVMASAWLRGFGRATADAAALERFSALKSVSESAASRVGTSDDLRVEAPFADLGAGTARRGEAPGSLVVHFRYTGTRRGVVVLVGGASGPRDRDGSRCFRRLRDDFYTFDEC